MIGAGTQQRNYCSYLLPVCTITSEGVEFYPVQFLDFHLIVNLHYYGEVNC